MCVFKLGISDPVLLDATVNSCIYLSLLRNNFSPLYVGFGVHVRGALFQNDGARSHTRRSGYTFEGTVLLNKFRAIYSESSYHGRQPRLTFSYEVSEGQSVRSKHARARSVSKSFRTSRLERELQMVQLSATSCIAIL
jgi:hypothetical protein